MLSKRTGLQNTALAAALALALAACSGSNDAAPGGTKDAEGTQGPVATGGTLKVLGEEDVPTVDTADAYDSNSHWLLRGTFRQLYANPSGNSTEERIENVPDLADGMPALSNGDRTYTIKIKQGVKWNAPSGARQITAQDAVRGLKFTCNPTLPFGATGYFTDTIVGMKEFCDAFAKVSQTSAAAIKAFTEGTQVSGLQAVDERTLKIDLTAPAVDFIHLLALPTVSPRPVEALEHVIGSPQSKQNIVESGPYQIETYVPDKSFVLTRNPAWNRSTDTLRAAHVDRVEIALGVDTEALQQQLQAGTADMAMGNTQPPAAALATLSRAADPGLHLNPTGGQNPYLVINQVGPNAALKKLEVRQALNYAVNKRNLVQVAGGPKVASPTGQIFSEGVVGKGFEKQDLYATPDFAGDPAKAKDLLAKAGYPNGLTLILAHRAAGNNPKYAATLVQDLKAAGITVTPKQLQSKEFYTQFLQKPAIAKAGQWDIALPGWSPDWEGAAERSFFTPLLDGRVYGEGTTNYGGYNDEAVNAAADKALATTDPAESARQWNAIDKMIMEDAPWVPIFNQTQANYVSGRVKNFRYVFLASGGDYTQVGVQ